MRLTEGRKSIIKVYFMLEVSYGRSGILQERKSNQRFNRSTDSQMTKMGFNWYGHFRDTRLEDFSFDEIKMFYAKCKEYGFLGNEKWYLNWNHFGYLPLSEPIVFDSLDELVDELYYEDGIVLNFNEILDLPDVLDLGDIKETDENYFIGVYKES